MTEINLKDIEFKKYRGFTTGSFELITHLHDLGFTDREVLNFIQPMINTMIIQSGNRKGIDPLGENKK